MEEICKADFNPRSPHGERPVPGRLRIARGRISTHAPRTGSDRAAFATFWTTPISTHAPRTGSDPSRPPCEAGRGISTHAPRTGSDMGGKSCWRGRTISTHAPRTGSDASIRRRASRRYYFNPRSPHGERQRKATILSTRIIGFVQKVYHKTVLLRIILAENAVILPKRPQNRCEPPCKRLEACASHA